MSTTSIVWEVPENLYSELIKAQKELAFPNVADFVTQAVQRYLAEIHGVTWQQEFHALQKQVRASGGFELGQPKKK